MPASASEVHARRGHPLGMSARGFLRDYWQKQPLLVRGAFPDFTPPLTPDELAGLACTEGALARIVTHRGGGRTERRAIAHHNEGRWSLRTGPFDDATFAGLPESGWTLLVQDADKWDAATARLTRPFAFIPSWRIDDVMVSYAVDAGGVGAHVDQYDVFLIQGLGRRRWAIDTRAHPDLAFREDVELKLLRTFRPTHVWTLEPGDVLYLPPGVPHDGVAIGECMTFSVGMRAPAAGELLADLAVHFAGTLPESTRYADPDLAPATADGEIDGAALRRARRAVGGLADRLDDAAFGDWFGAFITRYRAAQPPAPRRRPWPEAACAARLAGARVERNPWSRIAWRRTGHGARLYAAGEAFDAPLAWARVLASGSGGAEGAALLKLPGRRAGIALLAVLVNAGHFELRRR